MVEGLLLSPGEGLSPAGEREGYYCSVGTCF